MTLELTSLILLGSLLLMLLIGTEIAVAIGMTASIGLIFFADQTLRQFAYSAWATMYSFILTAVPLFVFMGAIFASTGLMHRLFDGANKLVGNLKGGLVNSVIMANAIFGAISGSSLAAVATFGKIAFPEMERLGYDPKISLGAIAAAGTLSVLIPPSLIFIVYGGWLDVSVSQLFAAGMMPGIILTIMFMVTVVMLLKFKPSLAQTTPKFSWREKIVALKQIIPFLVVIGIVLGMIFAGITTPTEAAAIGAILSIILALIYRIIRFQHLSESLLTAIKITSMLAFVMFTANVLGQVFQYIGVVDKFSEYMLALPFGRYGTLALICSVYIILGIFFDTFSMLILTLPFIGPVITNLGFDMVWFGVLFVLLAEMGLITPPFALNLFVLKTAVVKHDIMTIAIGTLPFYIPLLLMIVLLVIFPQIATWFPNLLFG
ncbi:TRAP transporter large permease [Chloroflexota bacterium]